MPRYLFASFGGATYSPAAVAVGSAEVDVENLQVIGIEDGDNPDEAWKKLIEDNPDIPEQGWETETIAVYVVSGEPFFIYPGE